MRREGGPRERARRPKSWVELEPTGDDPRVPLWADEVLVRLGESPASMKDLLFWGLDEARLDCDPRYLVAWLEAQGLAWWADDLWHLTFDGVDALEEARPRAERARAARLATKPRRRRGKPSCVDREALEAAMRADGVYRNARLVARALPLPPAARQVTYAELADETGLSRWQVRAAIEELKVARWLRVRVQICPTTGQKPNVMQLVERKASDSAGAVAA